MSEKNSSFRREGNELIHTRLLRAPRELVWEVWTTPEHMTRWWGPEEFTITIQSMDVKAGSEWNFKMHGLGREFENFVRYLEVEKPSKLTYRHSGSGDERYDFTVYVTLEEAGPDTLLTMRSVFSSEDVIEELNRKVNAIERGKETLNKLERYLASLQA